MMSWNHTQRPSTNRRDWHNFKSMLPYLLEFRGRAALALACLVLSKVATVGVPVVLKAIVDTLEGKQEQILILPIMLLLAYGALRLASAAFNELRDTVFARVRYHAMRSLSLKVFERLHNLSLRFHLERKTGAISRDLERGTRSVSSLMNFMTFSIIPIGVEFMLVAIILLSQYNILFTIITFSTVLAYIGFTLLVTEWRMDHRHQMNRLDSEANNHAIDSLINYETVKYFNNEQMERQRYDRTLGEWEDIAVKTQTSMSILNFGQSAVIATGVTVIMIAAAQEVVNGDMSIGDLVMVNAFMLQLFIPLGALGIIYRSLKYTLADMDMVFRLLETKPEVNDQPDAKPLNITQGNIRFEQVDFAYQDERQVLKALSFEVRAGQTVAVVGQSGTGKSTLARLLYRFYDIQSGKILIDNQDISQVTQQSLRQVIATVPQDTVLFNDTIRYNLQYGNMQASQQDLEQAAAKAYILDFINSLPDGWDTVVGERGLKLSGGEKQRIAIARAILKQPPIIIFDEATSSLDSATERGIQETLDEVAGRYTTLIIAHRLSTIVNADRILVMDKGQIIEQGKHETLLAQRGRYFDMWELQNNEEKIADNETSLQNI